MNSAKIPIFLSLFSFLLFAPSGNSQTLLNGDFENHSANDCAYNLENVEFNAIMQNITAFGNNSEVDIQTEGCGIFPTISNDWYVSLSQSPIGAIDQIALEIDQPLVEGTIYQLSYFDLADTSSNPVYSNVNMPIDIGLSNEPFSFGDSIHSSLPVPEVWTLQMLEFTAPNNGQYITIRMAGAPGLKGWNFVDGFKLSPLTAVEEPNKMEVNVYPNPVRDWVNIETDFTIQSIRLFNAMGQVVKDGQQVDDFFNKIDMGSMAAGVYFLEIMNEKGRVVERVEKY